MSKILDATNYTPSAGDLQAFIVHKIDDRDTLKHLAAAAVNQTWISEAAAALVFSLDHNKNVSRYRERGYVYAFQDATIAACYAQLSACDLGVDNCLLGAFDLKIVYNLIQETRPGVVPVLILVLGYAKNI